MFFSTRLYFDIFMAIVITSMANWESFARSHFTFNTAPLKAKNQNDSLQYAAYGYIQSPNL